MSDEYDYLFKSIVVGDGGVGKTALTLRFSKGFFTEDYKMTIGVDFHVKTISIDSSEGNLRCKLQIWDTGGQERFSSIRPMYYRGSLGGLLIFDLTSYESFEHLPQWIEEVRANIKNEIPLLLVGNKSDLVDIRAVSIEEINDFTQKFNLYYMETSAKTGEGVGDCFHILACLMVGIGVPAEFVAQGIAFNPGQITTVAAAAPAVSATPVVSEPIMEFEAPPVPEPEPAFTPEPIMEFEAPPIPEPEPAITPEPIMEFEAPPIPEPSPVVAPEPVIEFETPPVPEPEPAITPAPIMEFEAPPIPEPLTAPEPEIEFETPTITEPEPEIPVPQPEPISGPTDFEFKMPDDIISNDVSTPDDSPLSPLPDVPTSTDDAGYKPKAIPFSSNIPVPAPAPVDFQAPSDVIEPEPEAKTAAPFIIAKRPETPKPKPASLAVETPPISTELETPSSSIFPTPETPTIETPEPSSDSLVDYMPETILSKKERKKLEKQKKKEEKLRAKEESKRKIQEAKEKYKQEQEAKKKAKKEKKPKKEVVEEVKEVEEIPIVPTAPTPTPTPAAGPSSLFQTLSTKTDDAPLSEGAAFVPFSAKEKSSSSESSKLRIIPNVDDIKFEPQPPQPAAVLPTTPEVEKPKKSEKKKEIIICKQCGAILSSDYAFCNKCGSKL